MCGIAGLIGRHSDGFQERVGKSLSHRGPDDYGVWQNLDVCLVHRRLAILDLSPNGHQPMPSACGRWHLIFNGEIYNYRSLRSEMIADGQRFKGTGDTEVLLYWLIRHGTDGLTKLRGMYSFCLFDSHENTALLVRDPHGIKPLYYWLGQKGELAFASELRALLNSGLIAPRLQTVALNNYLCSGSVPEPSTLVEGIWRLPAGHWARWENHRLQVSRWLSIPEQLTSSSTFISPSESVQLCRSSIQSSVTAHLESDVPVGLFLSGGLDSAALLALAPPGLHAFTIGFSSPDANDYDETDAASKIAAQFNTPHVVLPLEVSKVQEWLPHFLRSQDQPSIDGLNTWCVSKLVREHGFKVAISGLGGDELFGGYPSFSAVPRLYHIHRRFKTLGRPIANALRYFPLASHHKLQRLAAMFESTPSIESSYFCYRSVFAHHEAVSLMNYWGIADDSPSPDCYVLHDLQDALCDTESVALMEGCQYLRNQLLPDSDVMAMATGLELRLPLVDVPLQRELSTIPPVQRFAPGKQLLRNAVPELPDWFVRRPKQGFRFPFQLWLDAPTSPLSLTLPAYPRSLDMRPWYRRWSLMVLAEWLKSHLGVELPASVIL